MTETVIPDAVLPAAPPPAKPAKPGFAFTDPGCRWEIRLGALLVLAGVFLWQWLGPTWSSRVAYLGVPLVLVGVVLQVRDARRDGRPGYPWKLALAMGIGGSVMCGDLIYRERYDAALQVQLIAPLIAIPGLVMLLGWPFARQKPSAGTVA